MAGRDRAALFGLGLAWLLILASPLRAEDSPDLFGQHGNSELPNVLYITPWKAPETAHKSQKLTLHSLYGDLFEPIDPVQFEALVEAYRTATNPGASTVAEHR